MYATNHPEAPSAAETIPVRRLLDAPHAETPRYWFDDDPFMTLFFNAVSSTFPEGERFFIRSVRHYAGVVTDPVLSAEVRAFVHQEAQHQRAHDAHIELLDAQGFTVLKRFNKVAAAAMHWLNRRAPRLALAETIGTEHLTAVFADHLLTRPDLTIDRMHPSMQPLWRWHAVEETEHRAVAFDVYQASGGGLTRRRLAFLLVVFGFLWEILLRHSLLLIRDRCFTPRVLWRGFGQLFGRDGLLRATHPQVWHFLRRDFHPNQHDNGAALAQARECLGSGAVAVAG